MSNKFVFNFSWKLLIFLTLSFVLQYFIYDHFDVLMHLEALLFSNIFNFFMAVITVFLIHRFRHTHTQSLGYIFLLASLFKFLCFYIFLSPTLKAFYSEANQFSGLMLFFTSYLVALIVEIKHLIGLLNEL